METSPEFELLAQCCRQAFAARQQSDLPVQASEIDWDRYLRLSRFHRVQGLAWASLAPRRDTVPPAIAEALAGDASEIAASNLRAANQCRELADSFGRANIPLLFVKGLTLGALAYGNPALKMGWDIDLLIHPADLSKAADLLDELGYRLSTPARRRGLGSWHDRRKESVWVKDGGVVVELHSRLADNPQLIAGITVTSPTQPVEVATGIRLPTLAADELFAYLSVHGASSAWFRLKWISDLAAILDDLPPAGIERLHDRSQELGAGRAAGQALLLADRLFGTLGDSRLQSELERDFRLRWLADSAFRQLAGRTEPREPAAVPLGTWRIHLTQLLLKPGLRFKLGELVRQARDALA
ncbi:MAG TPA: nucleotidyltransferase family protein [Sphingomicrobium sp.]|nr:nucleotidyltransferase family protein [Sphingomicrobium sp.]